MRVVTLTANLLAETTCEYASWQEGGTFRARSETFQVGGKGINVSRMLRRLGVETEALCFPGGHNGARCEAWLRASGIAFRGFPTTRETRAGWVVRSPGRPETTFLGADNVVDDGAVRACALFLESTIEPACLAICGSMPRWEDAAWSPLRACLESWTRRGHSLAVDTYGAALRWFATTVPCALVKINRREFAELTGVESKELTDLRMSEHLRAAAAAGPVQRWVITDGGNTVWSMEKGGEPTPAQPPRIREISPTGSGDVTFAALLEAIFDCGLSLAEALDFALPLGAANAASPGVAEFDLAPFGLADRAPNVT